MKSFKNYSEKLGNNFLLCQGPGGNTSIKLKENILFIRAESADKKGIGNAGKNIIVIDIKHKTLFVAMIDANQKLITCSSGLGPKPTILTNWINKHS